MANEYQWVKGEREQLLAKLQYLSDSELNYNFGFGHGTIKATLLAVANEYHESFGRNDNHNLHDSSLSDYQNHLSTLNFNDVVQYFKHVDSLAENQQTHYEDMQKCISNEFRHIGQIDMMLHLIDNSDRPLAERTGIREKVTERQNMRITRL